MWAPGGYFSDIVDSLTGGGTSYHTGYRDAGTWDENMYQEKKN